MKVLIGCEFSGVVRTAFRKNGHEAYSIDFLDADDNSKFHIKGDVLNYLRDDWDLAIFHPPCTHLAVSGARHFYRKKEEQKQALEFVKTLMNAEIPKICIENPVSIISTAIRKPDQIINPWQFGHGETKKTCLWLKNLPLLIPTDIVEGRSPRIHKLPPSPNRWKIRSITYQGIAEAMANQWGSLT